jgi:hypothetical protein
LPAFATAVGFVDMARRVGGVLGAMALVASDEQAWRRLKSIEFCLFKMVPLVKLERQSVNHGSESRG